MPSNLPFYFDSSTSLTVIVSPGENQGKRLPYGSPGKLGACDTPSAVVVCSSLDTSSPPYSFALVKSGFISSCFPFLFEKTGWGRAAEDGPHLREGDNFRRESPGRGKWGKGEL